ncbi:electron transport complex protein RnfC [Acetitomaculum ruminis DSM 5522]|uniref:Ion-translocating oxidoreductase complex subunit C n=1 Tax=Acetitomaculum ruminis DSM 5522 TaxID=1120918 RepID=A0A1I1A8L2_9FIRM|nr:electron transport complex subunit RsxC [Acetitomaculum ruminis]SFB32888.1 electron transport complex protein RnfC [Acetitomaculum ruminis DSM 5522]
MSLGTFLGGIHPYEGKELAEDKPIKKIDPKDILVYPMAQHLGAPANPVVKKGDKVKVGQRIGEASGFISANICSSVSGEVLDVKPHLTVNGAIVPSVFVKNDYEYETVEGYGEKRDYTQMDADTIRNIVKDAGVVGMGGAGFPANVKITPKDSNAIDYVLVNGAECEPYLTSDYRLMLEEGEKLVTGVKILLQLFPNAKGLICVEENKPQAIAKLKQICANESKVDVCELKTKYPQGGERMIIYAATGRKIYSKMLPADAGCIVSNVDTVISIYRAVCESVPSIFRTLTITGDAVANTGNYQVRTGMSYKEILEDAGGFKTQPEKIISGGPMMGFALYDIDVPVTKSSSALLALTVDEVAKYEPSNCIRCGRCVDACPSNLIPQKMAEATDKFDYDRFVELNGMECFECGSCTYVCPAKRRLTQGFKQARGAVAAARRAAAAKASAK